MFIASGQGIGLVSGPLLMRSPARPPPLCPIGPRPGIPASLSGSFGPPFQSPRRPHSCIHLRPPIGRGSPSRWHASVGRQRRQGELPTVDVHRDMSCS